MSLRKTIQQMMPQIWRLSVCSSVTLSVSRLPRKLCRPTRRATSPAQACSASCSSRPGSGQDPGLASASFYFLVSFCFSHEVMLCLVRQALQNAVGWFGDYAACFHIHHVSVVPPPVSFEHFPPGIPYPATQFIAVH